MKNLVSVFLLLFGIPALAQNVGYMSINLGPSIPIRDFGNTDISNKSAGLAKTGFIVEGTISFKIGKYAGISALFRGQKNWLDNVAIEDKIERQYRSGDITIESTSWSMGGFMIGPYASFPISRNVSFDTRGAVGFLYARAPQIKSTYYGYGSGWTKQSEADSKATFSYMFGLGFKFNLSAKTCLLTNIDYLGSKPEFTDVKVTSSTSTVPQKTSFSQSYSTINLMLGFGIRL